MEIYVYIMDILTIDYNHNFLVKTFKGKTQKDKIKMKLYDTNPFEKI